MSNVKALKTKFITPEILMQSIGAALPDLKQLYAVGIDKNGVSAVWASGDLTDLCYAARCLDVLADRYIRNEIEEEE